MKRSIPRFVGVALLGIALAVVIRIGFPQLGTPTPFGEFQPLNAETPPAWRLEKVGGGYLASNELNGSVALLYFWTTW